MNANFLAILSRLKTVLDVKTDKAVAEFLDISASTFSKMKSQDCFPVERLQAVAVDLDMTFILTGKEQGNHEPTTADQQQGGTHFARTESVGRTPDYWREQQGNCGRVGHFTRPRYTRFKRLNRRRLSNQVGQRQFCLQREDVADCGAFQTTARTDYGAIARIGKSYRQCVIPKATMSSHLKNKNGRHSPTGR